MAIYPVIPVIQSQSSDPNHTIGQAGQAWQAMLYNPSHPTGQAWQAGKDQRNSTLYFVIPQLDWGIQEEWITSQAGDNTFSSLLPPQLGIL